MSTATESGPTSLAERIAKVRNRMLVATLTKVPPSSNKELFVALCQIYEEHEVEKSFLSSESSDESSLLLQALSSVHEIPEDTREQWTKYMQRKTFSLQLVESDFNDNDDGFLDWHDAR